MNKEKKQNRYVYACECAHVRVWVCDVGVLCAWVSACMHGWVRVGGCLDA